MTEHYVSGLNGGNMMRRGRIIRVSYLHVAEFLSNTRVDGNTIENTSIICMDDNYIQYSWELSVSLLLLCKESHKTSLLLWSPLASACTSTLGGIMLARRGAAAAVARTLAIHPRRDS